jgi:hypothetical protein
MFLLPVVMRKEAILLRQHAANAGQRENLQPSFLFCQDEIR